MKRLVGLIIVVLTFCGVALGLRADDTDKEKTLRASLIGTWKMASMTVNGMKNDLPGTSITYKHVTPTGFMWLSHEKDTGKVFRAAGGTYTFHGDSYAEKIEYGMGDDYEVIKNGVHPFTARIEGDKWFHSGKLSNGTTIDEVWERVKPVHDSTNGRP